MRFQITIKEQAQATNGKAKYPLYKPKTQRNYHLDYGTETLNELIDNSSIKIYCNDCLKQITLNTIVVAYQDHEITLNQNQSIAQNETQKPLQNQPSNINLTIKQTNVNKKDNKNMMMRNKENKQMKNEDNQLFEQSDQSQDNLNNQNQRQQLYQMSGKGNMKMLTSSQQPQQQAQVQENKQQTLQVLQLSSKNQQQKQQQQPIHHYQTSQLYCVGCFSQLQEFPTSYTIRKSLNVSLKGQKWRIIDEICLLNGLKCWGFSNWGQIKEFMDYNGCPFTVKEIESHYEDVYLNGDCPFKELEKISNWKDKDSNNQELYRKLFSKPPKRSIEQIMHNYYFPKEQQQGSNRGNSKRVLQGNICSKGSLQMKRERPKEYDIGYDGQSQKGEQQQKVELKKVLSGHSKGLPSSMHPKTIFPITNNFSPSYTSLKSMLQKADIQEDNIHHKQEVQQNYQQDQNDDEDSESEDEEEEELFQGEEEDLNEIKLKPKESQMQLTTKVVHNNSNGNKFVNTNNNEPAISFNRSNSIKPQSTQKLNTNQQHITQTHTHHHSHTPPIHPTYSNLKGHNVYSYNPKRKQFQIIEYDYYAETMLAQLQFLDDDTQEEQMLKIKIIEEYNRRLDERIKRREFVIQHRLLETEFMIKTLQKYNPNHVQRFQPFRRLVPRNQEYFQMVSTYDTFCKTKAITQGMMKIKKKLKQTMKKPTFQNVLQYLGRKKQKKEVLGQRGKFEREKERRILRRQSRGNVKMNKRVITSMSQNSSSYVNIQQNQIQLNINQQQQQQSAASRRMTSRSQQRQRLRSHHNQNISTTSKQVQKGEIQSIEMQEIGLSGNQMKMVSNQLVNYSSNNNSRSIQSLISEEDMLAIEKMMQKQLQLTQDNKINKQNTTPKPVVLKNNLIAFPLSYWLKDKPS